MSTKINLINIIKQNEQVYSKRDEELILADFIIDYVRDKAKLASHGWFTKIDLEMDSEDLIVTLYNKLRVAEDLLINLIELHERDSLVPIMKLVSESIPEVNCIYNELKTEAKITNNKFYDYLDKYEVNLTACEIYDDYGSSFKHLKREYLKELKFENAPRSNEKRYIVSRLLHNIVTDNVLISPTHEYLWDLYIHISKKLHNKI